MAKLTRFFDFSKCVPTGHSMSASSSERERSNSFLHWTKNLLFWLPHYTLDLCFYSVLPDRPADVLFSVLVATLRQEPNEAGQPTIKRKHTLHPSDWAAEKEIKRGSLDTWVLSLCQHHCAKPGDLYPIDYIHCFGIQLRLHLGGHLLNPSLHLCYQFKLHSNCSLRLWATQKRRTWSIKIPLEKVLTFQGTFDSSACFLLMYEKSVIHMGDSPIPSLFGSKPCIVRWTPMKRSFNSHLLEN